MKVKLIFIGSRAFNIPPISAILSLMDEPQTNGQPNSENATPVHVPDDVATNRDIAAFGYEWILSVVGSFSKRHSPFVQCHAKQGMVLFVASILVWLIPFVGKLLELIILALCVLGFLAAAQGQWKDLPLVGPLARGNMKGVRESWRSITDAIVRMWHELMKIFHKNPHPPAGPVAPAPKPPVPSSPPSPTSPTPPPIHHDL